MASRRAGPIAYQGFTYQFLATVWVALDLMVVRRRCTAIVIEPPSQEDIEATLGAGSERTHSGSTPGQSRLHIQLKRRRTGPWTSSAFGRLLKGESRKRGASGRASPLENLEAQEDLSYRLVTDAAVMPPLKSFTVEVLDTPGRAVTLPGFRSRSPQKRAQARSQASRVGILELMTPQRLQDEIQRILSHDCRVPMGAIPRCKQALIEAVQARVADDRRDTVLPREELVAIILQHDGHLDDALLPPRFVPPLSYPQLRQRLEDRHRLLLVGPSGIGKTTVADALAHEHAHMAPPFELLRRRLTPGEIRQLLGRPGRMLFVLEDPWGLDRSADDAQVWTNELPRLFAEANSDKRFLVTSRDGLFNSAMLDLPPASLANTCVHLGVEEYGAAARWDILQGSLDGAEDWHQDFASHYREHILSKLTVPLALSFFGEKLRNLDRPETRNIDTLIYESLTESIGRTVLRAAAELPAEDVAAVTIVRALMRVNQGITEEEAGAASRRHPPAHRPVDVLKALRWLKRARWLKGREGRLQAHPLVLEGLAQLVEERPADCEGALLGLIEGLVSCGELDVALRISVSELPAGLPLSATVRAGLDAYLLEAVHQSSPEEFFQRFDALARHSGASDPVSLLARALILSEGSGGRFDRWRPPKWSESEWERVRRSDAARGLAESFVRHVLPNAVLGYDPDSFLAFLRALGWDLSDTFRETARSVIGTHAGTHDVIFEGALSRDASAFEELLSLLLTKEEQAFSAIDTLEDRERYEKANEEVLDAGAAELVHHDNSDIAFAFSFPIRHLLRARRRIEGYDWILHHPQRQQLWHEWGEVLRHEPLGRVVPAELIAFLENCPDTELSMASIAISEHPSQELTRPLIRRLRTASLPGIRWCLEALSALHSPQELEVLLEEEAPSFSFVQRASMATAAAHIHTWKRKDRTDVQQVLARLLTPEQRAVLNAIETSARTNPFQFKAATSSTLEQRLLEELAEYAPERIAAGATFVLAALGASIRKFAPRLLASEQPATRHRILGALGRTGAPQDRDLVRAALVDPNYKCRILALWMLARDASPGERAAILERGRDDSAPVRQACASVIGAYKWEEGLELLCTLLSDRRNFSASPIPEEPPEYEVARTATRALARFSRLPTHIVERCLRFLARSWTLADDFHVPVQLIHVLARHPGDAIRKMLEARLDSEGSFASDRGVAFPLRYAAAWGLVERLETRPAEREKVSLPAIRRAAAHSNPWLAAPGILALALCAPNARSEVRQWLGCRTTTPERVALWITATLACGSRISSRKSLQQHLPPDHAFWSLLRHATKAAPLTHMEWGLLLQRETALAGWLARIGPDEDVNACLRRSLSRLLALDAEELRHDDFRTDVLPPASNWYPLRLMTPFE